MKKTRILFSLLALSLVVTGCKNTPSGSVSKTSDTSVTTEGSAPTINGVLDEVSINLGESWNALAGVTATDDTDGDLTAFIEISSIPAIVNNDGVLTPEERGDYFITYSVTNSLNLTTEAYTTLTVLAAKPTERLFREFELSQTKSFDQNGWELVTTGAGVATIDDSQNALIVEIETHSSEPSDIKLVKEGLAFEASTNYILKFHTNVTEFNFTLELYNGETLTKSVPLNFDSAQGIHLATFTVEEAISDAKLAILLSGSANETLPYVVLYLINLLMEDTSGEGNVLLDENFLSAESWGKTTFDGASATLTVADGALSLDMSYASNNNPWTLNLFRNTGQRILRNEMYKVIIDIETEKNQFYELCIEDSRLDWQVRAGFKDGTLTAGTSTIEFTFKASIAIDNIFIKLALGRGSAATNVIKLTRFTFLSMSTVVDSADFTAIYSKVPWILSHDGDGDGSVTTTATSLIYNITAFGNVDWHNKIAFEGITLPANASYKFTYSLKGSTPGKVQFIVNRQGEWNPLINVTQEFTNEAVTYTFEIPQKLFSETKVDIFFQFGGFSENIAPMTIELSEVKIWELV
ncbi:MAG: Carbohydrate binding domain protein [Tenericutes bacterium ADurb.Bin239]|nr:MAG: Carbohydrate binding domain protein [Tenericutes bacterium ADurb.Bin239]